MRSLLAAGLVDEIRLLVCPVTRGTGTRVFDAAHTLEVVEATAYPNGLALLHYALEP
jgi:riboflavin biosynthesis pyrimidine reductase